MLRRFNALVVIEVETADAKISNERLPDHIENKLCDSLKYVEGVQRCDVISLTDMSDYD